MIIAMKLKYANWLLAIGGFLTSAFLIAWQWGVINKEDFPNLFISMAIFDVVVLINHLLALFVDKFFE